MLTPPDPISPIYEDNIDTLIQDLLKNQKGIGSGNIAALFKRAKNDQSIVYEILESLKKFNQYAVQSDWIQTDNTAPDYIKNKPTSFSNTTSNVLIDGGTITAPNYNLFIDCGSIISITP